MIGNQIPEILIITVKDIMSPPEKENVVNVYIAYKLMDTDQNQVICSSQPLTEDHCQGQEGEKKRANKDFGVSTVEVQTEELTPDRRNQSLDDCIGIAALQGMMVSIAIFFPIGNFRDAGEFEKVRED